MTNCYTCGNALVKEKSGNSVSTSSDRVIWSVISLFMPRSGSLRELDDDPVNPLAKPVKAPEHGRSSIVVNGRGIVPAGGIYGVDA